MIKGFRYYRNLLLHRRILRKAGIGAEDFFIVSFPKSGNTWLRFIIATALFPDKQFDLRKIESLLPTMFGSNPEEMRALPSPRFIKSHGIFFSIYPKVIYICRDYRDAAVSLYFHAKNRGLTGESISAFLRSDLLNIAGPWHWHVSAALEQKKKNPDKIFFLRYEDLLASPEKKTNELLEFCRIKTTLNVSEIVARTTFHKLRTSEEKEGSKLTDASGNFFFRKGESGDWKNYLSAEDESFLLRDPRTRHFMKELGYLS
jgi:estrone sulfotransferase